jgi:hypothetical protein
MIKWLKREFFGWFAGFKDYISGLDSCELCGNEQADNICVGCERRETLFHGLHLRQTCLQLITN